MFLAANLILFCATSILLYKLVSTNHWTTGKKNLVAIIASLVWKFAFQSAYSGWGMYVSASVAVFLAYMPLVISIVCVTLIITWFNT